MSNKNLIIQYANTGAIMTKHQLYQLPTNIRKSYLRRRINQMMDADFDDYDINSHELVAMPEDVRNEFFGMFDDHNTIDDVLLSKTKSNPEDRFKASVLYIQYKGSNLTEMDISGIIEANRGSDEIARIIVEAKGDKLEYSDIISIIRKVKYPNAFADNPYFVKGLRRLMADNDMLYSVMSNSRGGDQLADLLIDLDFEDGVLDIREYYTIIRNVNNPAALFSKLDIKNQKRLLDALKPNHIYDFIAYSKNSSETASIVPKDKLMGMANSIGSDGMNHLTSNGNNKKLTNYFKELGVEW